MVETAGVGIGERRRIFVPALFGIWELLTVSAIGSPTSVLPALVKVVRLQHNDFFFIHE
jgi:hypothetical protein